MEQEGEGRGGGEGGDENKQLQPQPQPQPSPQQQPHQHQKCPRCESLNTKFCYYNNYSLSQPRYFCKACKRYWTQGGTLRNIPVGGGSRKGKRAKSSSSSTHNSSMSQSQLQPQPSPQEVVQNQPNLTTLVRPSPPTVDQSTSPYYQGDGVVVGGGYLSSLAAVHSLNPSSQPFNQSLNVGVIGDVVGSSNSSFLISGFNAASLGSQQHHGSQIRPSLFYQMGNRDRVVESLLPAEQGLVPSSLANSSAAASHPYHWPQSFINNANHRASDSSLWSTINTTSISDGNTQNNIRGGSSSLIPNHWPDLPGYGPPQ